MPDALSRIYETDGELSAAVLTTDDWYNKRFDEVDRGSRRFPGWKIAGGKLYFRRPRAIMSQVVDDLEQWKLIVPRDERSYARVTICHSPAILA